MHSDLIKQKISEIDGYEDIQVIEGAGQSYAFSAYDRNINRKLFLKAYWFEERYKDSLLLEPQKLSALYHKNDQSRLHIVGLYHAEKIQISSDSYILLQMEFCEGADLSTQIGKYGMPISCAITIGKDLCEGIYYLHSAGIVHRDIKPANIMINDNKTKIIDLGSAMQLNADEWKSVTSSKTFLYNPPEVIGNEKKYAKVSDVFQIGAVLWEMINGKFDFSLIPQDHYKKAQKRLGLIDPIDGFAQNQIENEVIIYLMERGQFYEMISPMKKHIPNSLQKLLKKATSFNPSIRFDSCANLRIALSALSVPNWEMKSETNFKVKNWKGKDYNIDFVEKKGVLEVQFETSMAGCNNFRRSKKNNTFELAINEINS